VLSPVYNSYYDYGVSEPSPIRIRADFNGLFTELLCLSHKETCIGENGQDVSVHEGMTVTAFDEDIDDDGKPDKLIASGTVEKSPEWLRCKGSVRVLRIDRNARCSQAAGLRPNKVLAS
jgi:hypothetical protein